MKWIKPYLLFLSVIFSFASCTRVSFLYPVSERSEDRVYKKELLGEWREEVGGDKHTNFVDTTIDQDSSLIYSIKIIDKSEHDFGDTSFMAAKLFSLQKKLFLEVSTNFMHEKNRQIGIYNAVMILPSYQVIRIFKLTSDSLQMGQIDGDTLVKLIKEKKFLIKHEMIEEGDILILEKPTDLQRKLLELEKFPGIYEKTMLYKVK